MVFCFYYSISHDNPALVMMTPYRQLHWSYLIYYNVHLLLFPSSLSAEVSLSTIAPVSSLSDPRNLLTLLTFASVCLLFFRSLRTNDQTVLCGLVLLVVPFLPASNLFFPVGFVVAERVLYLPSMGFCLLVGVGSYRLHRRYPMLIKLMLGYLLLAHGVKTVMRNRAWFSNYDLFRTAVVTSRSNAKMINNLATEVDKTLGNRTLAVELLQLAVETEPHFITAYINLGYNLRQLGRMDHALKVGLERGEWGTSHKMCAVQFFLELWGGRGGGGGAFWGISGIEGVGLMVLMVWVCCLMVLMVWVYFEGVGVGVVFSGVSSWSRPSNEGSHEEGCSHHP